MPTIFESLCAFEKEASHNCDEYKKDCVAKSKEILAGLRELLGASADNLTATFAIDDETFLDSNGGFSFLVTFKVNQVTLTSTWRVYRERGFWRLDAGGSSPDVLEKNLETELKPVVNRLVEAVRNTIENRFHKPRWEVTSAA